MRVLLDQGLPRSCADLLRQADIDVIHTGDCGLACATDAEILEVARKQNRVVVTLDSDFHALLALSRLGQPSVVRIRIEGLRAEATATLLRAVLARCSEELASGAAVSVEKDRVRIRRLPIGSSSR